jgi:hypothetical protein
MTLQLFFVIRTDQVGHSLGLDMVSKYPHHSTGWRSRYKKVQFGMSWSLGFVLGLSVLIWPKTVKRTRVCRTLFYAACIVLGTTALDAFSFYGGSG